MSSFQIDLPQGTWVKITDTDKDGEILHLRGKSQVVYVESKDSPVGYDEETPSSIVTIVRERAKYNSIPEGESLWAYAITGNVTISKTPKPLSGLTVSLSESATINGCKFDQIQEFIVDINTPLYVLYELPVGEEVTVELIKRFFKTDDAGADMLVLWDYDVSTATKTPLVTFNENNEFRGVIDSALEVSVLNPVTISPLTGVATLTGAATVINDGIVRESSFIPTSGVGSNTTGDIDPATGFRRYASGTGFLFKVTSRSNDNKIAVGYTWTETGC